MSVTQIIENNIQASTLAIFSPSITSVQVTNSNYTVLDDTAVNTAGGYIKITGSRFSTGAQVYINDSVLATSISYVSSTILNVQVPATVAGSYSVTVVNTNGTYCVKPLGITFSPLTVTWVTNSTLTPFQTGTPISLQLTATGAAQYQLQSGSSLPSGLTLSSSGLLSGTVNVGGDTTYNFTIEALDSEYQEASRTFSLKITLDPPTTPSIEYLVVAGGGSGATEGSNVGGGGGGAGGLLSGSVSVVGAITYTVTVGNGGAGISGIQSVGNMGANSSIIGTDVSITAIGGGGGGRGPNTAGNGGSGGGTAGASGTVGKGVYPGSTYIDATRQGYDGALGIGTYGTTSCSGGGGGGAGGPGQTSSGTSSEGLGGVGVTSSISGTAVTYSTGGNGGAAASGTGGAAGAANTGNGGGGSKGTLLVGGAGGSGIVIIRYSDTYPSATSTTGSPTYTVSGGYRVYKFTGSGTITF